MEYVSPEKYREFLDGIELEKIYVKEVFSQIEHDLLPESLKVNISDDTSYENTDDGFIITSKYSLNVKNKSRKIVLKISAAYVVEFLSETALTDDIFEIYKEYSLPLNVWPFFRELCNSITSRMNIPPLTLPLYKQ